jgi:hypothetical protein
MITLNKISKVYAPVMALMILLSSSTFIVDFHFCQGHLKSFSLFGEAKNCHELAGQMASCKHHQKLDLEDLACSDEDKNCCSNNTIHFEPEIDNQYLTLDFVIIHSYVFVVSSVIPSFEIFIKSVNVVNDFLHYKPPLIQKDISVLFETFLI